MNKPLKTGAKIIASLLFVLLFTRLWLARPDLFPKIPNSISERLVVLYGAQNAEQVADLELLVGVLGASLALLTILLLGKILEIIFRVARINP